MKLPDLRAITLRDVTTEAKLLLIGIPVFLWTMLPLLSLTKPKMPASTSLSTCIRTPPPTHTS